MGRLRGILYLFLLVPLVPGLCPPTGPVLPPPRILESFRLEDLKGSLNGLSGRPGSPWNTSTTSFSLQITSRQVKFFEYHHTAQLRNSSGVQEVRGDTVYRAASVTKVFTVLSLLLQAGKSLELSIVDFLPQLNSTRFGEVTLRMLASQLGGVPRWGNAFDLYTLRGEQLLASGFPRPPASDVPECDTLPGRPICTRAQFFEWLNEPRNDLAWQPADRAAYSNPAYTMIALALEKITGKPFKDLLREDVLEPVGLEATGFEAPLLARAIIPVGMGSLFFPFDIGNFKETAGLYSTPDDLAAFLRSILNNQLLSPALTRHWLKPAVFSSSLYSAVGMPWEIFRVANLTPLPRPVDIYTKSGSMPGYAAYVAIMPEYDVGVTINVAGDDSYSASVELLQLAIESLVPRLEELARDQALSAYAGRYESTSDQSTSSITLAVDNGPGLRVTEWISAGSPVIDALEGDATGVDARIYPIGEKNRWRVAIEPPQAEDGHGMFNLSCQTWLAVDNLRWAGLPVDEVVFLVGEHGVEGIRSPGLRQQMRKI